MNVSVIVLMMLVSCIRYKVGVVQVSFCCNTEPERDGSRESMRVGGQTLIDSHQL